MGWCPVIKRLCLLLALMLPLTALAQTDLCSPDYVLIYSDFANETCFHDVQVGEPFTLDIVAFVNPTIGAISTAHFSFLNWPADPDPGSGSIQVLWTADDVVGNMADGLDLHWETPLTSFGWTEMGEAYLLGTVEIVALNETWLSEPLLIDGTAVFDNWAKNTWGDEYRLDGGRFILNDEPDECGNFIADPNPNGPLWARHFVPTEGAQVPNAFDLEFEVYHYD